MATEVGSTGDFLQYGQTVLLGVNEQIVTEIYQFSIRKLTGRAQEHGFPFHEEEFLYLSRM